MVLHVGLVACVFDELLVILNYIESFGNLGTVRKTYVEFLLRLSNLNLS